MSSPSSRVSIVLPVYQGMPYLREAVESVLKQTLASFELVVGDDCSMDTSRAYLESLRDPRVRFFPGRTRIGLFPNVNRLISRCRSGIVRFLCQDDALEPDCLETEVDFFNRHPEVGMTIAKYRTVRADGTILSEGALGDLPEVLPSSLAIQHFFYHGCIAGNLSTVCVRASELRRLGGFDETFRVSGDYDLWSRIALQSPVGIVHSRQVRIRQHERQLSRQRQSAVPFVLENARIRRKIFPALPPQARNAALHFERRRHHVLGFHQALSCLLRGRWRDAQLIFQSLGSLGTLRALASWVWTLNNRRRPQAPWVLS